MPRKTPESGEEKRPRRAPAGGAARRKAGDAAAVTGKAKSAPKAPSKKPAETAAPRKRKEAPAPAAPSAIKPPSPPPPPPLPQAARPSSEPGTARPPAAPLSGANLTRISEALDRSRETRITDGLETGARLDPRDRPYPGGREAREQSDLHTHGGRGDRRVTRLERKVREIQRMRGESPIPPRQERPERPEPRPRPMGRHRDHGRKRDLLEGLRMLHRGVSIDPFQRLVLETKPEEYSTRVMDLIAPIGRGQRCLITSPPKAGKTMLLMAIAHAIISNHRDVDVVVLLVDERPEEVTYFRRGVNCEVVASSNDMTPEEHIRVTEETVIRVAEDVMDGRDVVLLLDSITRLARAYNVFSDGSGRTLSGGLDASTMYGPRRIFGAARKIENGGSLTIVGTALVDTGSRMDEVIFQEFKGTGNTEVVLSRDLANKRIFPSIDIQLSGSRKEEKLYPFDVISRLQHLRRFLADRKAEEAMLGLIKMLERYRTNAELLRALGS